MAVSRQLSPGDLRSRLTIVQHHPISDQPAYFIHPCNTPEALSVLKPNKRFTPEDYLVLCLGLIGSSVGLHIPSKLFDA